MASKRECAELTQILRDRPLRARKRRDFEIWARAVDRWVANPYDSSAGRAFHAQTARDAAALRDVRRYVKSPPPALDGPAEALLAYLGGFFSGEGCFGLSRLRPSAVVKLRRDDRAILELRLAGRRWDRARVERAAGRLTALRQYREPPDPIVPAGAEASARDARRAYMGVLRAFADELPAGKLTRTAYAQARARHPEWPTRDTLARAFGSWAQALAAAGLGARTGRS